MIFGQDLQRGLKLIWLISWQSKGKHNPRKQKWNCKRINSNRNRQHLHMFQRRLGLIRSPRLRTMTSSIMMMRSSQFLMCFLVKALIRPSLKWKKILSSKKLESSSLNITREDKWTIQNGSQRWREKFKGLRSRIRHLITPESRESSRLRRWVSCNVWISRRTSFRRISKRACSSWPTKIIGVTPSRTSWT